MKFDNAFKTKTGTVGIQFYVKGEILTVYENEKGEIVTSPCTDDVKVKLVELYNRRKNWYFKGEKNAKQLH